MSKMTARPTTADLAEKYRRYLESRLEQNKFEHELAEKRIPQPTKSKMGQPGSFTVGIVGGGMAGLYSALLLRNLGIPVKIFEAENRVGGRVYTHRFSDEEYQYFEGGAMRLPDVSWQKPVFDLIDYLNKRVPPASRIETIPYTFSYPSGNRVYVNATKQKDGKIMTVDYANAHLDELGFPRTAEATVEASQYLHDAIEPVRQELQKDFPAALKKYDSKSLFYYLYNDLGWSDAKINYVEVMTSQTNEFQEGLVDQAILDADFIGPGGPASWKTINHGMSRLPEAVAMEVGEDNIHKLSKIVSIAYLKDGRIQLKYEKFKTSEKKESTSHQETFDAVILAVPPNSVQMLGSKPTPPVWPVELQAGFRSIHFQPLYKIGLRFKSRFWERKEVRPSLGGQSISDLPCRWVVYPSYGIGDKRKGVLLQYSWMTDANHWLPASETEKVQLALQYLQELYPDVNIPEEYAGSACEEDFLKEAFSIEWAAKWPLGDATFYANQFTTLWPRMVLPRGNIFFAGEHLSVYHTWIVGAMDSAKVAVQQLLRKNIDPKATVSFLKP